MKMRKTQPNCSHVIMIMGVGRQAKPGFQPRYGFKTTMEAARRTGISGLGDCVACFLDFRVFWIQVLVA